MLTGVAGTNGELWKEHRKFSIMTLKHFGVGRSIIAENINIKSGYYCVRSKQMKRAI